jgi:phosphopantetheine adenylyltransferase
MSEELDIEFEHETIDLPAEEVEWSHETLNQFELLIDSLGIETVFFLLSKEHESIISNWVKNKVDIQKRTKQ